MTDRIYVTYKPTIAPESYHIAIHYERTDSSGNVILHRAIDGGPQFDRTLSAFEKAVGTIEEMFREDSGPSRFGKIVAGERPPDEVERTYAYENISEGADLSSNWAKMQLFVSGFNSVGFIYRGEHQNSNTFAGAALEAGELPGATEKHNLATLAQLRR
jgi:hypothetical protein